MIDLIGLSKTVLANKVRREFNTSNMAIEVCLMTEELGELARATKLNDERGMADAVADLMVFCLGICAIRGYDPESLLINVVRNNEIRTHAGSFPKE